MTRIGPEDRRKVADAIRAAERTTDGEINAVMAASSDRYSDAVLHWALLASLLPMTIIAAWPGLLVRAGELLDGGWNTEPPLRLLVSILLFKAVAMFLIARFVFGLERVRFALVPHATKARRVRRRAILLFRTGTERRTLSKTGVLVYLSLAERRAEIVADAAIHAKVPGEHWGAAMAALLAGVGAGRPGDGMADAIARIGAVLAEHFPYTGTDPNELPDRLIEL